MTTQYLSRYPQNESGTQIWTWSCWIKSHVDEQYSHSNDYWDWIFNTNSNGGLLINKGGANWNGHFLFYDAGGNPSIHWDPLLKDITGWYHLHFIHDSTCEFLDQDRARLYINGIRASRSSHSFHSPTQVSFNDESTWNTRIQHTIGRWESGNTRYGDFNLCDMYFIDGQVVDVGAFGHIKHGYGARYHSYSVRGSNTNPNVGVDMQSGEWFPNSPSVVRAHIDRGGGFGPNGFYLPFNSGKQPGADFHIAEPDTILKLKTNQPQPKAEIDGDPKSAFREDPLKDYLVLAVPGVKDGLQGGFGDYSHIIRGSGAPKPLSNNGVEIKEAPYNGGAFYGSSMEFSDGDYLDFGNSEDFNFGSGDFTIELWRRRGDTGSTRNIIAVYDGSNNNHFWFGQSNSSGAYSGFWYYWNNGTNSNVRSDSTETDYTWDHLCAERYGKHVYFFLNGQLVDENEFSSTQSLNSHTASLSLRIGRDQHTSANYSFVGGVSDIRVYKGVAKYKGAGFDCPNPYTPLNFGNDTSHHWRGEWKDTPRNNYPTLSGMSRKGISSLKEGGTRSVAGGSNAAIWSDMPFPAYGKWYMEVKIDDGEFAIGFAEDPRYNHTWQPGDSNDYGFTLYMYYNNGNNKIYYNGSATNLPSTWVGTNVGSVSCHGNNSAGDVYRVLVDRDAKQIIIINPCGQEGKFAIPSYYNKRHLHIGYCVTTTWGASDYTYNWGQREFTYDVEDGYKTLCTQNLNDPPIRKPTDHFAATLYYGTGNAYNKKVQSLDFKPDLVVIKERSSTSSWAWFDTARGSGRRIGSDSALSQQGDTAGWAQSYKCGFNDRGFSLGSDGSVNQDGQQYVAYCWKAGGPDYVQNTKGNKISYNSVNKEAGFSITKWTGDGTSLSVSTPVNLGHGLSKAPKFSIVYPHSDSSNSGWWWYLGDYGDSQASRGRLNSQSGLVGYMDGQNALRHNMINEEVISLTGAFYDNNIDHVYYAWHEVEGYSKFGVFTGNGDNMGPFVYCGFKPALLWMQPITQSEHFTSFDVARNAYNGNSNHILYVGLPNGDSGDGGNHDFFASGFRITNRTGNRYNGNGVKYMFAAWAESPYKYGTAK